MATNKGEHPPIVFPTDGEKTEEYSARFRSLQDFGLPFQPPNTELAKRSDGFNYTWSLLCLVFHLPDPKSVPPYKGELSESDQVTIKRFIATARDLAGYDVMNHETELTMHFGEEMPKGVVEKEYPARDAQQGFSIQLRQLHGSDRASFQSVQGIVMPAISAATDGQKVRRNETVRAWGKARSSLLRKSAKTKASEVMLSIETGSEYLVHFRNSGSSPEELLKMFFYGDRIHWGDRSEEYEALMSDPTQGAVAEFDYLVSAVELAHFYMGYSKLLEVLFEIEEG